jgi:hypothetical protein
MLRGNARGAMKRTDSTATAERVKLIPAKSVRKETVRRGREGCARRRGEEEFWRCGS